ncbi:MAG TPA: hypothetical protein VI299_11250 [Polyangiales bacterium]
MRTRTLHGAPRWLLGLALWVAVDVARAEPPTREPSPTASEDEWGFGESTVSAPSVAAAQTHADEPAGSAWHVGGYVAVQSAFRLARSGPDVLGKLRQVLAPRLEYQAALGSRADLKLVLSGRGEADFAYLLRPDAYDQPTMELYGSQLIAGESYLSLFTKRLELAVGEQIVNFGQGEVLTLLDVVNPRDLREPLFTDLDQIRLPVLMSRATLAGDRVRADLLAVHEPYFGLIPPPTGEFSPLRKLLLDAPLLGPILDRYELGYQHLPRRSPLQHGVTQFHGQLGFHGARLDLTLQASSVFDALGVPGFPSLRAFLAPRVDLPSSHPRYTLLGHSGALGLGPVVLRWELAGELKHALITRRDFHGLPLLSAERFDLVRGLVGVTYVPNARTNLGLEASQSVLLGHTSSALLFPVESTQLALRFSQQLLRERAQLTCVLLWIGVTEFNAAAARLELSYQLRDAVRLAAGAVGYLPSDHFGVFYGFERNHRAYLNLRWDFVVH